MAWIGGLLGTALGGFVALRFDWICGLLIAFLVLVPLAILERRRWMLLIRLGVEDAGVQ